MVEGGSFLHPPLATWFTASVCLDALSKLPTKHAANEYGIRQSLLYRMIQSLSLCRVGDEQHVRWWLPLIKSIPLVEAVGGLSGLLVILPEKIAIPYSSLGSSRTGEPILVDEDVDVAELFQSLEADLENLVKLKGPLDSDTHARALVAIRRIIHRPGREGHFVPLERVLVETRYCKRSTVSGHPHH